MKKYLLFTFSIIVLGNGLLNAQTINTIIGSSIEAYGNNHGYALNAQVNSPIGMAFDKKGNWYVADKNNNCIRRVDSVTLNITTATSVASPTGIALDDSGNMYIACETANLIIEVNPVTGVKKTLAGNDTIGYSGDGGIGTKAKLNYPFGIALDAIGNVYIGDMLNNRIREINIKTGIITTVVGNGSGGFSGDNGPATAAMLNHPAGIAFDNFGNLYIADVNNNRIRKVDMSTGIITTVAGNKSGFSGDGGLADTAGMSSPYGVVVDKAGNLFIADYNNNRIREVIKATGIINSIAGSTAGYSGDGGIADTAKLNQPMGIALSKSGNIFISDNSNNVIRQINISDKIINTVTGDHTAGYSGDYTPVSTALIDFPDWVTTDIAGNIYFAEAKNATIREINVKAGRVSTIVGTGNDGYAGDGGPATACEISGPTCLAIDKNGNIYVDDYGNGFIRKVDAKTGIITRFAGTGGMTFSGDGGPATAAAFDEPVGVALDRAGNVYVADQDNFCVRKIAAATGIITTVAGTPNKGGYSGDGGPATAAELNYPCSIAFDSLDNMYIADQSNNRIRLVSAINGVITTIAGTGIAGSIGDGGPAGSAELNDPIGITFDKYGSLYIADQNNEKIRVIRASTGIITTIAGNGTMGFSGDGGMPDSAEMHWPSGMAVDTAGNIFIADQWNNRIREIKQSYCVKITQQPKPVSTCVNNSITFHIGVVDTNVKYQWMINTGSGYSKIVNGGVYTGANNSTLFINQAPYNINGARILCKVVKPFCDSATSDGVVVNINLCQTCGYVGTVAGDGNSSTSGDNGPAIDAGVWPSGIAVDSVGDIFIADERSNRVRKVINSTGKIITVAGNGNYGYSGMGGQATAAEIGSPIDVALDRKGNLYIQDGGFGYVSKVNLSTGKITSIACSGVKSGFSGDGGPATAAEFASPTGIKLDKNGNVYIVDEQNYRIRKINATTGIINSVAGNGNSTVSGDGGPADSAALMPEEIALDDSGNMYIADIGNHRIRKVYANTGIIITLIGGGTNNFTENCYADSIRIIGPNGLVVDKSGNLLYCETGDNSIRKYSPVTGRVTTIAGNGTQGFSGDGGPATSAMFSNPLYVAFDTAYNLYITDNVNYRIRKVILADCNPPCSLNIKLTGKTLICPGTNDTLTAFGGTSYVWSNGATTSSIVISPIKAVTFTVSVTNGSCSKDTTITVNTNLFPVSVSGVTKSCQPGQADTLVASGGLNYLWSNGNTTNVIIAQPVNPTTYKVGITKGTCTIDTSITVRVFSIPNVTYTGSMSMCKGIADTITANGALTYLWSTGDTLNSIILNIDSGATYKLTASNEFCMKDTGITIAVHSRPKMSLKVSISSECPGALDTLFATGAGTGGAYYWSPASLLNKLNDSTVLAIQFANTSYTVTGINTFGCSDTTSIKVISSYGNITTVAGNGTAGFLGDGSSATAAQINNPGAVAVDDSGNIYIADFSNNRIRKVNSSGIISTLAGNGTAGYNGDGIAATAAELNSPSGVAIDAAGNVYIADEMNERIRIVNKSGIINTFAGNGIMGDGGNGYPATTAEFRYPVAVAADKWGNIYIVDQDNMDVRKVNTSGIISTIAGRGVASFSGDGGPGIYADLNLPCGVAADTFGNVYIADAFNNRIRKVNAAGIISTIAGDSTGGFKGDGGPATSSVLNEPEGVAADNFGNVYIADWRNMRIRKINSLGIISTVAGDNGTGGYNGDGIPATNAEIYYPNAVTSDNAGNIFISDEKNNRIREVSLAKCDALCNVPGFDLAGNLQVCIDTPSFNSASIQACIYNTHCLPITGTLKLLIDTALHFTSTVSDTTVIMKGDTLLWHFSDLSSTNISHCVSLTGSVSNVPAGDSVFVSMFITPTAGDSVPANNSVTYWVKAFPYNCVGLPFDPNEKSVLPEGNISATQQLSYTIHFQNTGTAPAKNVVVIDTLSPYVDPTTLKVTSASSEVSPTIVSGNIVKFAFNNINLPDTATSKTSSIGVVKYTINPAISAQPGDVIYNGAGIYFDANPVVKTNTTKSPIVGTLTGIKNISTPLNIAVFPNPFTTTTSIIFNTDGTHYLELDDVTGRKIQTIECTGKQFELQRNNLASGIYFIRAYDEGMKYVATAKVVVQ